MTERLFMVTLVDRSGNVMAGGHYLARDAAHARAIGSADLTRIGTPEQIGQEMHDRLKAKVSGWWAVRARPSKAARSNALNRGRSA